MGGMSERFGMFVVQIVCAIAATAGFVALLWAGIAAHGPVAEVLVWSAVAAVVAGLAAWPLAALIGTVLMAVVDRDQV